MQDQIFNKFRISVPRVVYRNAICSSLYPRPWLQSLYQIFYSNYYMTQKMVQLKFSTPQISKVADIGKQGVGTLPQVTQSRLSNI